MENINRGNIISIESIWDGSRTCASSDCSCYLFKLTGYSEIQYGNTGNDVTLNITCTKCGERCIMITTAPRISVHNGSSMLLKSGQGWYLLWRGI